MIDMMIVLSIMFAIGLGANHWQAGRRRGYEMKCSKCGGKIKNLPEYLEETKTEVLCSQCAGTVEHCDEAILVLNRIRYGKGYFGAERGEGFAA